MTAAQPCASLTAHSVDLVDEDDGGSHLLGLIEKVTHAAGADAHIQFHEVGAGNGEELHPGLPRHCFGQQGLAGSRRADQQHALGDAGAQLHIALRVLHEFHDFLEFFLFLVLAGYVRKSNLLVRSADAGACFAEAHGGFIAAHAPVHHGKPQHAEDDHDKQIGQEAEPPGHLPAHVIVVFDDDPVMPLLIDQLMEVLIKHAEVIQLMTGCIASFIGLAEGHDQRFSVHDKGLDLFVLEQLAHLGIAHALRVVVGQQQENDRHQNDQDQDIKPDISLFIFLQGSIPPSGIMFYASSLFMCRMHRSGSSRKCSS